MTLAEVVLDDGGNEAVVARIVAPVADLAVVEALARLRLAAAQAGCSVRLRQACPRLVELIALAGLADVLPASGPPTLPEARRLRGGERPGRQRS